MTSVLVVPFLEPLLVAEVHEPQCLDWVDEPQCLDEVGGESAVVVEHETAADVEVAPPYSADAVAGTERSAELGRPAVANPAEPAPDDVIGEPVAVEPVVEHKRLQP